MEPKIRVQEDVLQRITKARTNFKKSAKDRMASESYLSTRLKSLEDLWKQFTSTHNDIVQIADSESLKIHPYFSRDVYDTCQELYTLYSCEILEALDKVKERRDTKPQDTETSDTFAKSHIIRLPKITIPSFSGTYSEWMSFRDLFISLVHNNTQLDNVQKLHYLKCHLSGEAEQLLRHIPITHNNYLMCWTQLQNRYDNKRYLANCILKNFMGQRNITTEAATALRGMLDCTNESLCALQNIGIDVKSWDTIVIYILCFKLDNESRKQWELKVSEFSNDLPTLNQFRDFLETRYRALEFIDPKLLKVKSNVTQVNFAQTFKCIYCSEEHRLYQCKSFSQNDVDARREFVQTNSLCYNCLESGHSVYACRHTSRCRICRKKHHSLLHPKTTTQSTINHTTVSGTDDAESISSQDLQAEVATNVTACFSTTHSQVLLATALVNAESKSGSLITLRCLLDQGSQASFITEAAVQLLGLKKVPQKSAVVGIGGDQNGSLASKSRVSLNIQSLHDSDVRFSIQAFVLNKLTSILPEKQIVVELWSEFAGITLADPAFGTPNQIDVLLGADVYGQILLDGLIKASPGAPIAQNTKLGWIMSGPVDNLKNSKTIRCNCVHITPEADLLKRFWEQETDSSGLCSTKHLTEDEERCENIFIETTSRDPTGRYVVNLPFRNEDPGCKYGKSKDIAIIRFKQLEKRLSKDPRLKAQYSAVMTEYLDLGHMEIVPEDQKEDSHAVYLPHHAVVNETKDTTKVRIVFNAAETGINGTSLNDDLLVGPKLQDDLRHIIMRWRSHPICIVADIIKMYRQIKVTEKDIDFQRLVWRDNPEDDLQHLRLLRVTFGTASAPYLAVRCLHQLAREDGTAYPVAAEKLLNEFYMDDLMTGCETMQEGKSIYVQLTELLKKAGFELQKWSSNSNDLLKAIDQLKGNTEKGLNLKLDTYMKILGLTWNRAEDTFEYEVKLPQISTPVTKRKVISNISRLFDPLGWLAPVIITAKVLIQKLWLSGIGWDDILPTQLLEEWVTYQRDLNRLTKFRLPRWMSTKNNDMVRELQGFCDASNDGFAAVVYLRVIDNHGKVHINLITAKTKVAPIKQVSIPRLELCGAVLLTRLLLEVSQVLGISRDNLHAWTDSTIVLAWLNSRPNRWKTYVANRVSEIITSMEPTQWSHVSTNENPADCATRGTKDLDAEILWKRGPSWLKERYISYQKLDKKDTSLEEKSKKVCLINKHNNLNGEAPSEEIFSRFSSLTRLVRVIAIIKRWTAKTKKQHINTDWIESREILESLKTCIKMCQHGNLAEEIKDLKEGKDIKKNSKLTSLNPFLDEDGILRVGGRLCHTELSEGRKHPIILPQKSEFTRLLVADSHKKTLHGGNQLMLNYLRTKYWVIGAKLLVKACIRKCIACLRHSARTRQQLMGQLPIARATAARPFLNSGVDYAGPINVRTSKGRGHHSYKGYICLFICMSTRAIHLELVSDLTSQGFLAAYKRFVARRGHVADLWSDNGTNFVGASRELKSMFADERSNLVLEIAEQLATNGTTWHFIPPHAPHFGGLWESGVKSTKHHLRRLLGTSTLTFEEMTTLLTQIEACLNSRPISKLSNDAGDPMPLTPGHFLIGEPLVLPPDYNYEHSKVGTLRRWHLMQRMVQGFWRRWSKEYLTQFHQRHKWVHQQPEPEIGDVVLVMENDLPPARWLYGIIIQKHSGLDGITRVVSLKCKNTIVKRPISKLCFLPTS